MKKYESPLQHLVTISKEYRRAIPPRQHLEELISNCKLPIKRVYDFEDVFVPVSECDAGMQTLEYAGQMCKAMLRVQVLLEGEFSVTDIEKAFNYEQDHIRVFLEFLYERP